MAGVVCWAAGVVRWAAGVVRRAVGVVRSQDVFRPDQAVPQGPTWHVEGGDSLIHVKHIGAGADVDASILGLHIADGEDAVEVHGPTGQLAVVLPRPDQRVGRGLWKWQEDEKWQPDSHPFSLLDLSPGDSRLPSEGG